MPDESQRMRVRLKLSRFAAWSMCHWMYDSQSRVTEMPAAISSLVFLGNAPLV